MAQAQVQTQPGVQIAARTGERPPGRHFSWFNIIIYIFLVIFTISAIGPLIFTFLSSFKTFHDVLAVPPTLLPNPWTWGNYAQIVSDAGFLRWILNAFIYAIGAMILNVFFSAMPRYALARLTFPRQQFRFTLPLSVMLITIT